MSEVEHILSKYKWAKDAQKKIDELKKEGKEVPKSFNEVQKLMGSTPLDVARSNMSKSGKIGRNDPCSCGSGKKYKRYGLMHFISLFFTRELLNHSAHPSKTLF
ncbi:hypothetical protein KSP40_PGU010312 [Platanthera guangdongensis]